MMYSYVKFELNVCNHCRDNEQQLQIFFFSKFKRNNCQTIIVQTWPVHSYDISTHAILTIRLIHKKKIWKFLFFLCSGAKFVKNQWTITKFELDLHIPMKTIYTHAFWTLYIYIYIHRVLSPIFLLKLTSFLSEL
jgi:hypothetical protein